MNHIHWYPGHIAKAEKQLKEKLNLVDVVIEVIDARLPISSKYPDIEKLTGNKPRLTVLNKSDLADEVYFNKWIEALKNNGCTVLKTNASSGKNFSAVINTVVELGEPAIKKLTDKGLLPRPVRVIVMGMPNVGKSSIINKLVKRQKTKTGAKAGVTRQQQWVKINDKIDLLDTPGIIPLRQDDQNAAYKLAIVNSIGENAYDAEFVAEFFLKNLKGKYLEKVKEHYKVEGDLTLENIAKARNWIVSDGDADITRCAIYVLTDFREGRLGRMTLDELP